MMIKKLSTSLVVALALSAAQAPVANVAFAAGAGAEKEEKRPVRLVSPSVGKKSCQVV